MFQFHALREAIFRHYVVKIKHLRFQSTPSAREGRFFGPHDGGNVHTFQSTPLREGRFTDEVVLPIAQNVSIHALREGDQFFTKHMGLFSCSIHAPARGRFGTR